MSFFAIYDLATGDIRRVGQCPESMLAVQAVDGEGVVAAGAPVDPHAVRVVAGELVSRDAPLTPAVRQDPQAAFRQAVAVNADVQALRTATAAEIDAWVDANVTTIAGARRALKLALKLGLSLGRL